MGLVAPGAHADGDHRHPLGPGNGTTRRPGVEAHEGPGAHRDLLPLDLVDARAGDDDIDLLLGRVDFVVLATTHVRTELEPVDAEGLHAELAADEAHRPARPLALHLLDVHDAVAHRSP